MSYNDSNDEGFTGFRYLVDAKNSRQYALEYVNDQFVKPIRVFAGDQRESGFKPNETIFAFEHDFKLVSDQFGNTYIEATPFQIKTDENGEPRNLVIGDDEQRILYEVGFTMTNGVLTMEMQLTPESVFALEEQEFSANFPSSFSVKIDPNDPAVTVNHGQISINAEAFSFPPHHAPGAAYAQQGVSSKVSTALTTTKKDLAPKFNKNTTNAPRQASLNATRSGFKVSDSEIEAVLKKYAIDLTERAQQGKLRPVIGRDNEVVESLVMMSRLEQGSLCFTGDAGVGKSAMFSAVAQYIANGEALPENLQGARVIQVDLQAMNAGAQFRGQFEQRLKPLIDGLQERQGWFKGRKIILAIDEIHSQLTSGKAEGGTDAANIMKPFLASEGISVMGTTTTDEYRKFIEKDPALSRRFEEKFLDQPNEEETFQILKDGVWPIMKEHHGLSVDLSDEDMRYVVTMTSRYAPNDAQPSKSKKVIDMAAASAQFRGDGEIQRADIIRAVSQMSKLPESFLAQEDYERLLTLEDELADEVLGQESALKQISDTLIGSLSGLGDPNRPLGCFVLEGPPGVGKTETAKALARKLFGSEDALIKLDMSEYMEKHEVAKLIGAPPGYVGYDDAKPALTDRIRSKPYCVLLLDEAEKAHPDVWNILLAPLNDGVMKDNKGKTASFKNVLILMTSNLGAKQALEALKNGGGPRVSFAAASQDTDDAAKKKELLSKIYGDARRKHYRPEFIDRVEELGGFVTYSPLNGATIESLTNREIKKFNIRLSDRAGAGLDNVTVEFSREIMNQLAAEGYVPDAGARPLKGLIRKKITNPLGVWLLKNKQAVIAFAAENGGAKLLIDSLADFAPKLIAAQEKVGVSADAAASNDNTEKKIKLTKKIKGPKQP